MNIQEVESVSVTDLILEKARQTPEASALLPVTDHPISYSQLFSQTELFARNLRRAGIRRNDRVAIVLPNGIESALAFLGVASCATAAPLNPSYQNAEFSFYLSDLNARALIVDDENSPALTVATSMGIPVLFYKTLSNLQSHPDNGRVAVEETSEYAQIDDIALVLHTSGTTSRPKIVPLTHKNLLTSARNVQETLQLERQDRCLNIMPLFHIHGLVASVLASLSAGASVICTPGFFATDFFSWIDAFKPTWYTAVPTMHQAILSRVEQHRDVINRSNLRFIRSSSSSLPPQVMQGLEHAFGVPVVEAYGMTEAAHQMACNPLPPGLRKPGSVGLPAGPEIAIMDGDGRILASGAIGEIVIHGDNVTPGYDNNVEANQSAYTSGWFRTGDQGYFDADGYLYISGRIKEIINRGGEKISPREIDEVLLDHPALAQVVTFAVPDIALGEEIAAAVVLKFGCSVSERELKEFAAAHLAPFKVPRLILFLNEIPKGATGKLQRIGLAEKLGIKSTRENRDERQHSCEPRTDIEEVVRQIWIEVLGLNAVGSRDHFLDVGGDSMLATRLANRITEQLDLEITVLDLFEAPTIHDQAELIAQKR